MVPSPGALLRCCWHSGWDCPSLGPFPHLWGVWTPGLPPSQFPCQADGRQVPPPCCRLLGDALPLWEQHQMQRQLRVRTLAPDLVLRLSLTLTSSVFRAIFRISFISTWANTQGSVSNRRGE